MYQGCKTKFRTEVQSAGYQRSSPKARASLQPRPNESQNSLLQIPGVGKRARDRLADASVDSVTALCQLYIQEHNREKDEFIKYLQGIGITSRWTSQIADWVHAETKTPDTSKITLCVEGNIAAGKSTWLDMVKSHDGALHEIVEVVPEPVNQWQDCNGENLLELFYQDPEKYAFAFQQYVLISRLNQEKSSSTTQAGLRLLERSVFCDRMVFVRATHALKQLNNVELEVYDSFFNPLLEMRPQLIPDGFVYLKTDADTCARRMMKRSRMEESSIPFGYLQALHRLHHNWLVEGGSAVPSNTAPSGSIVLGNAVTRTENTLFPASERGDLSGASFHVEHVSKSFPNLLNSRELVLPPLPGILEGNVVILDRGRLKKSCSVDASMQLHLVPALHVDCVSDVDLSDPEVTTHRSKMMQAYREWVREYQTANNQLLHQQRNFGLTGSEFPAVRSSPGLPSGSLEAFANMAVKLQA